MDPLLTSWRSKRNRLVAQRKAKFIGPAQRQPATVVQLAALRFFLSTPAVTWPLRAASATASDQRDVQTKGGGPGGLTNRRTRQQPGVLRASSESESESEQSTRRRRVYIQETTSSRWRPRSPGPADLGGIDRAEKNCGAMGRRFMRWVKQLLTGRKEGRRGGLEASHVASEWNDGPEREKRRWSFAKQRRSGVDGGSGRTSGRAAVARESPQVKSFRRDEHEDEEVGGREEKSAVLIQKTFRGYLARKALRALRSLVKIQALVRGYLVRKQTAMTLRRLQTLVRLQADSIAVKKASYRKSMEQVRISEQQEEIGRLKPPSTPVHRRRLSDSTDSNYERSPRIVEMDTCHLRSRSSRMAGRYTPADHPTEYRPAAASCSPLPGGKLQPARLSFRRSDQHEHERERDPRVSKTAHNTPRFAPAQHQPYDSPAKSVVVEYYGYGTSSTPRRTPQRDALVSPRYMAGTASSAARTRCHSAPRQRQHQRTSSAEASRTSLTHQRAAGSRRSCAHAHGGVCSQCSDGNSRRAGYSDLSVDDEAAARDYYLDSLW